ncbi:hypothetical protein LTR85_006068 [Meristemomyces frigidus]|nr:hypothetical protein LTR85_006068 [Meristemomyces frigidus]
MAEAIAVVGALSSVLQLIEFAAKTASYTQKLIKPGDEGLRYNNDTERLLVEYDALGAQSQVLKSSAAIPTIEEQTMSKLGSECREESRKLLEQLQALKIDPNPKGVKRFVDGTRKAVKNLSRRKEVEASRQHLHELNGQLATATLQHLRARQQSFAEPALNALNAATETLGDDLQKMLVFAKAHERLRLRTDSIIESLHFPEIQSRWRAIEEPYPSTYYWALSESSLRFRPWLETGDGIFWVTGKAGSGKSTLMKFICEQQLTLKLLAKWCDPQPLVLATFYFWYAGTSLQKSTSGLLRTVLHRILSVDKALAQIAFPRQFLQGDPSSLVPWKYSELVKAVKSVASHQNGQRVRTKFCMFIDGLDEYNGNHMELVALLKDLARNPDIKLCVSSRPWKAFRSAFESKVSYLRLEDLSRPNIKRYVAGSMQDGLAQVPTEPGMIAEAVQLIDEIVDKAEGVFLWVYLVVKSILRGLAEGDPIHMLRHRVQEFPAVLEEFFRNMLSRVDGVY